MGGTKRRLRRVGLLAALGAIALVAALSAPPRAAAYDRPALLEQVASHFALRPAEVRCPSTQEWLDDPLWGDEPDAQRPWAYTIFADEHIVLQPTLCAGAEAVTDSRLPAWQRATGTLVLVHEAFHVRHWRYRRDEATVECKAIQNFTTGAELLGASPELANDLLKYAIGAHEQLVQTWPRYSLPSCQLPLWSLAMTS